MRRERCEERKEDNCGEEKIKQKPLSRMMKHSGISENPEEKIWKDVRIDRVMCMGECDGDGDLQSSWN